MKTKLHNLKNLVKGLTSFKGSNRASSKTDFSKTYGHFPFASASEKIALRPLPSLSVVIPVFNHRHYLKAAVSSVVENSPEGSEVIIINDGSTDGVEETLSELKGMFPEIKIVHQKNSGISGALNRGIELSSGELLSWQSADNLVKNQGYSRLVDFMAVNPQIEIAYGNISLIDQNGKPLITDKYRPQDQLSGGSSTLFLPAEGNTLSSFPDNFLGSMFLFRRESVLASSGYQAGLLGAEDYALALELARYGQVAHIDFEEPLGDYRLHQNTLTSSISAEKLVGINHQLIEREKAFKEQLGHFSKPDPYSGPADLDLAGLELERDLQGFSGPLSKMFGSEPGFRLTTGKRFENTDLSPTLKIPCQTTLPEFLTRARSSNFKALQPQPEKPALLIFPCFRDELAQALGLAEESKEYDLSLLVTDNSLAAEIPSSSRLRLLDVSAEYKQGKEPFSKALLYILSSVDGTISLTGSNEPEFLCQAIASAMAGVNMGVYDPARFLNSVSLLRAPHTYSFSERASFQNLTKASDAWLQFLKQDRSLPFLLSHRVETLQKTQGLKH